MIPANLGRQLEAALFAIPVPATALKPA